MDADSKSPTAALEGRKYAQNETKADIVMYARRMAAFPAWLVASGARPGAPEIQPKIRFFDRPEILKN